MIKHPVRDYYLYKGLTNDYHDNSNYSDNYGSVSNGHHLGWIIGIAFVVYLIHGDTDMTIAVVGLLLIILGMAVFENCKLKMSVNQDENRNAEQQARIQKQAENSPQARQWSNIRKSSDKYAKRIMSKGEYEAIYGHKS